MNLSGLVNLIIGIINGTVIPLIFTAAFVYFLTRLLLLLKDRGLGKPQKQDKVVIFWGILGLAVMIAMWGLVNIVVGTFFGPDRSAPKSGGSSTQNVAPTTPQPPKPKILPGTDDPG
jgi:hypothetical protein